MGVLPGRGVDLDLGDVWAGRGQKNGNNAGGPWAWVSWPMGGHLPNSGPTISVSPQVVNHRECSLCIGAYFSGQKLIGGQKKVIRKPHAILLVAPSKACSSRCLSNENWKNHKPGMTVSWAYAFVTLGFTFL